MYAYRALRKELDDIDEFRFIFTGSAFAKEKAPHEAREFYIPRLNTERSLYGADYEIKLRNELNQQAIAKECANWIRRKACFKSSASGGAETPAFMAVQSDKCDIVYNPFANFATADLGLERGNMAYSTTMGFSDVQTTRTFLKNFNILWNNDVAYENVTNAILDSITAAYKENSPELIYYLALYNIFKEFLEDLDGDNQPRDVSGFKDSTIWNKLYDFQKDAALSIISKLEKHNGCILADSVGLGKTFTALAVIKYYECRNDRVLVLCPKRLSQNWNTYNSNYRNNPLIADRLNYDVLYHTDLNRDHGDSNGIDLANLNWDNYDLIVIDESHNFRNGGKTEEQDDGSVKENRYAKLLDIIKSGAHSKVLMLSATPVNTDFTDLKNQLMLASEGDSNNLSKTLDTNNSVDRIFKGAQDAFRDWSKLPVEERTTENLLDSLSFDFFKLLDSVTIARSRKHIEKYYNSADIGKFPNRLKPVSVRPDLTDGAAGINIEYIVSQLSLLNLDIYAPLKYVFPSHIGKYKADADRGNEYMNRENGRVVLMQTNLLKRLESSIEAFRLTLQRMYDRIDGTMDQIDRFRQGRDKQAVDVDRVDMQDLDFDDQNAAEMTVGKDQPIFLSDMNVTRWRSKLAEDREVVNDLLDAIAPIGYDQDAKLQQLTDMLVNKVTNTPTNPGNRKVIIFTAFADTADYIYEYLSKYSPLAHGYNLNFAVVTGGDRQSRSTIKQVGSDFNKILTSFSPISKERPESENYGDIDILIATDCISEGQNLQDCDYLINYDIHWNPVRIIQRFGRIDRLGSRNAQIQLVNFWPNMELDEYIDLNRRVKNRMSLVGITSTGENVLNNTDAELEYRKRQLSELKDEVVDIEDMSSGVSITDLGLSEFQLDLKTLRDKYGDADTMPHGINAIAACRDESTPAGVIYILRNVNDGVNIDKQNRLHPFYLVYVRNDGSIAINHLQAKDLLDKLRWLCRDNDVVNHELVDQWKEETNDGRNMRQYSDLLSAAIQSIITTKHESLVDSLFTAGGTSSTRDEIKGLNDFELIDFLIVR